MANLLMVRNLVYLLTNGFSISSNGGYKHLSQVNRAAYTPNTCSYTSRHHPGWLIMRGWVSIIKTNPGGWVRRKLGIEHEFRTYFIQF